MKKTTAIILLCTTVFAILAGCGSESVEQGTTAPVAFIGNPWSDWDSLEEAESAAGFSLGIPETIADTYNAEVFRTMNNELLEVVYRDEDFEVCVRKQKGEGQDISGDYNEYDTCAEEDFGDSTITSYHNKDNDAMKQIISVNGYSWSLVAPNGYHGEANTEFLNTIFEK